MGDFRKEVLDSHNKYRLNHGCPALTWSSKLEANAQKWAKELTKKGYLQHAEQSEEGENLAAMKGADLTGDKATDMWYDEVKYYNFKNPGFNSKTGHFTQLIWASSLQIGVAKATASNGMQFVVARYFPAGNMLRKFPDNVKPAGSKTNVPSTNGDSNNNGIDRNNTTATTTSNDNKAEPKSRSLKDFSNTILRTHNQYRKRHGAPPLKWDSKLTKAAQQAAEDAAKTNTLRSVDMSNVGQNMAAMTGGELTGDRVSTMWYEEENEYNYNAPGFSSSTGSFTQLVWKGTANIGIGRAFGEQGQTFVIALYTPPGNIRNKYEDNVSKPTGPMPKINPDKEGQGCNCVIL